MTTAKVDIKIGDLSFAGEGDKEWLSKQLDKLIEHAPALLRMHPQHDAGDDAAGHAETHHKPANVGKVGTLAAFLAAKNAKSKDVKKFLGTAAWLHAKGNKRLTPVEVNKALDENSQGTVTNPALILKRLVGKGHCERSGGQFYVTQGSRRYSHQYDQRHREEAPGIAGATRPRLRRRPEFIGLTTWMPQRCWGSSLQPWTNSS